MKCRPIARVKTTAPSGADDGCDLAMVWDGEGVDPDEARDRVLGATVLIWLFVIAAGVSAVLVALTADVGADRAVFESVSALSGSGLSAGVTDASLGAGTKATLVLAMLAGRVELSAFLALAAVTAARVRND